METAVLSDFSFGTRTGPELAGVLEREVGLREGVGREATGGGERTDCADLCLFLAG